MYVRWSTEDLVDGLATSVLPLDSGGVHVWELTDFISLSRTSPNMEFQIFFEPGLHWITLRAPLGEREMHSQSREATLSYDYETTPGFNQEFGTHLVISVKRIRVEAPKIRDVVANFMKLENHKVSMLLRIFKREKTMIVRSVYIGRAQQIQTTEHAGTRTYTWTANEGTATFDGIGFRRPSDLGDLDAIVKAPQISPRPKQEYVQDHDGFHNEAKVLPVGIELDQILKFEVFNLKYEPPRSLEIQVAWKELVDVPSLYVLKRSSSVGVKPKRFSFGPAKIKDEIGVAKFEARVNDFVILKVTYERLSVDKLVLREICLVVEKYLLALHYMGASMQPKTI